MEAQQNIYEPSVGDRVSLSEHGNCVGIVRRVAGRMVSVEWIEGVRCTRTHNANEVFFLPTAKQIAAACAEIQRGWSREERERRAGYKYRPADVTSISNDWYLNNSQQRINSENKLQQTDESAAQFNFYGRSRRRAG